MKILFATAEAHPLMKTGGLGDVCGSLPGALRELGHDVRMALPAYPQAVERTEELRLMAEIEVPGAGTPVRILQGLLPGPSPTHEARVPVYLIDAPLHFARPGHPYLDAAGRDWSDNAQRFATFARAVVALALDQAGLRWRPELVHAHDWHTGLVPALLAGEPGRPATVFTIHNLAYQGLFPAATFGSLGLPGGLWSMHGLEFWGQLSFIKGGLVYADWITAVSPTYAREILTPEQGCGLDGLLRHRQDRLVGILNGSDRSWDPEQDPLLAAPYARENVRPKRANKLALLDRFGLAAEPDLPLVAFMGRLVEQKGVDLVLESLSALARRPLRLLVVGTGERRFAQTLQAAAEAYPGRVAVHVGYDEPLAHAVFAGADAFLMPSRFEPCGLTQLYALRYGTVPIVRSTGGLCDTVVDATPAALAEGLATGFRFERAAAADLVGAVDRALGVWQDRAAWRGLQRTGMTQDFSWERSAGAYQDLYASIFPGAWRVLPRARTRPWAATGSFTPARAARRVVLAAAS